MQTIGIFGGSFNPVHIGHTNLAQFLSDNTELDEVWLMLSPCNPLKNPKAFVADEHRLAMLQIAVATMKNVKVCDIELSLPRPSYTINTLEVLKERYPNKHFKLIIGSDNWLILDKWKDSQRIISDYGVVVYPRPGYEVESITCDGVELVDAPVADVSSTQIRELICNGRDVNDYLLPGVIEYIEKNNLYKP